MERELWDHARIQVNHGKTQVWNRSGSGQPIATICSSGQTVNPTKCGGETPHCRSTGRVSPFWEPLWGIQLLWKPSSPRKLQTQLFSRGSLRCKICSVLGSYSCFALHHEKITSFVLFTLNRVSISRASRRRNQRVPRTDVAHPSVRRSVANGHSAVLFGRFGFAERREIASHGILGQLG